MSKDITYNPKDKRRRPYLVSCDWLSISIHTTPNFRPEKERQDSGYSIKPKPYGTKMWANVAEIFEPDGELIGTLAWHPRNTSITQLAGIMKYENKLLYEANMWDRICASLIGLGLKFKGISRLDIACDFNEFFNGLKPESLIAGYISGEYVKVGLNKAYAFIDPNTHTVAKDEDFMVYDRVPNFPGSDQRARDEKWVDERNKEIADSGLPHLTLKTARKVAKPQAAFIQSLTFGRASNPVQVILYCKSKELQEVKMKRHIVDCWKRAGLDLSRPVWRVEIRLRSEATKLENLANGEIQSLSLVDIISQRQFEAIYTMYAEKYFKWYRFDGHAKVQNCPRQQVFSFDAEPICRPKRVRVKKDSTPYIRGLVSAINKATAANIEAGNHLMALHCKRVADFFGDCFEGLSVARDNEAKVKYMKGLIARPMNETEHTAVMYDGYSMERAAAIAADVESARRRYRTRSGEGLVAQYIRTQQRTVLDDFTSPSVDPDVIDSIYDAIINSIFTTSKNLTYD